METKICPEQQVIQQWIQGDLTADDSTSVSQHVSSCEHCQSISEELKSTILETADFDPAATATATGRDKSAPKMGTRQRASEFDHPVEFGDYQLLGEIARGGMGVVYRAKQTKVNRVVALKMILAGSLADQDEIDRFYAEAEAAANLDHPNIVPVFDVGEAEGRHFFSMAFIQGQSLSDVVGEQPLTSRRAAALMVDVSGAVQYAHERGIIHRDLKPANILLENDSVPRVTDFGLAKRTEADTSLTMTGQVMGTPSYMPPEQATGSIDKIGPTSDVYSLGAVLYHLLTGRPPFRAASMMETLDQVVHQEPVPAKSLNPTVDSDLDTITLKALQKSTHSRYASAAEFRDDLQRFLEQRPIKARRTSATERTWRWARRNPLVATLLLATTVTLLGALSVSSYAAIVFRAMAATETELREKEEKLRLEMTDNLYRAQLSVADDVLEKPQLTDITGDTLMHWYPGNPSYAKYVPDTDRDLRGWEWYFIYSVTDRVSIPIPDQTLAVDVNSQSLMGFGMGTSFGVIRYTQEHGGITWNAHEGKIVALQFTKDGSRVATGSLDGTARIWAVQGREKLAQFDHGAAVHSLSFNPDASRLVTHGTDGRLILWDAQTGDLIQTLSEDDDVSKTPACSVSPDGSRVAVAIRIEDRYAVRVLELPTLQTLHTFDQESHTEPIQGVCWSPDGNQIASASLDRSAKIWDLADKTLECSFTGHDMPIQAVDWHPDGNSVATAGQDMEVFTWDPTTGKQLAMYGHSGGEVFTAKSLAWDPNGTMLVTALSHGLLDLINLAGPRAVLKNRVGGKRGSDVAAINWHPTENLLAATHHNETKSWQVTESASNSPLSLLCWNHDGSARAFIQDSQLIVMMGEQVVSQTVLEEPPIRLRWSPTDNSVAIQFRYAVKVWRQENDTIADFVNIDPEKNGQIDSTAWSHDATKFVVGTSMGDIKLVSGQTGADDISMRLGLKGHQHNRVRAIAWRPNSSIFAIAASNGYFYLYDYDLLPRKQGEPLKDRGVMAHQSHLRALAWSPDGTRMASGSADRTVNVWDLDVETLDDVAAKHVLTLSHDSEVRDIAWHPQGKRVATLTDAGELTVYDASHGYQRAAYFDAHPDMIQWGRYK